MILMSEFFYLVRKSCWDNGECFYLCRAAPTTTLCKRVWPSEAARTVPVFPTKCIAGPPEIGLNPACRISRRHEIVWGQAKYVICVVSASGDVALFFARLKPPFSKPERERLAFFRVSISVA